MVAITILLGTTIWAYQGSWQLWRLGVLVVIAAALGAVSVFTQRTATKESMPAAFQDHKIVLVEYYSDF